MPREVRFTVRMSRDEMDMLTGLASLHERDKGKMIRWLIKIASVSVGVGECSSSVRLACVTDASSVRLASDAYSTKVDGTYIAPKTPHPDPEEEKKNKTKKKRDPQLAPLDVTKRILDDLNERTGNGYQSRGKVARRLIQARMNDGYVEADFIEVNRKMSTQWMGDEKMERCLNFETLYGPKFEKYIGGKDIGPQGSNERTPKQSTVQKQAEQQNFDKIPEGWI